MKRMLIAVAALGLAAGAVRADWGGPGGPPTGAAPVPQLGGPNTLLGMTGPYNGAEPDKYGLHPRLKKLFRFGRGGGSAPPYGQMGYTQNGPSYNPNGFPAGA
jgi:hypothetical protein